MGTFFKINSGGVRRAGQGVRLGSADMPDTLCLSWDRSLLAYNFGAQHPMSPIRLDLTARLIDEFGLFKAPGVRVATPTVADDELLRLVHTQDYIDAVRRVS